jgi:hypothetical protein
LEEGKKEAEDWLRLKNEHVRAQSRLWQWYLWKCLVNEEDFGKNIVSHLCLRPSIGDAEDRVLDSDREGACRGD